MCNFVSLNIKNMSKILCRTCAEYGSCKLDKKGTAIKCRKFWEHISTLDFEKSISKRNKLSND